MCGALEAGDGTHLQRAASEILTKSIKKTLRQRCSLLFVFDDTSSTFTTTETAHDKVPGKQDKTVVYCHYVALLVGPVNFLYPKLL